MTHRPVLAPLLGSSAWTGVMMEADGVLKRGQSPSRRSPGRTRRSQNAYVAGKTTTMRPIPGLR